MVLRFPSISEQLPEPFDRYFTEKKIKSKLSGNYTIPGLFQRACAMRVQQLHTLKAPQCSKQIQMLTR